MGSKPSRLLDEMQHPRRPARPTHDAAGVGAYLQKGLGFSPLGERRNLIRRANGDARGALQPESLVCPPPRSRTVEPSLGPTLVCANVDYLVTR